MNDLFVNTEFIIFLTETWSAMYNSCTGIIRNKSSSLNFEASVFCSFQKEIEKRFILNSFQIFSCHFLQNFIRLVFAIELFESALSHNVCLVSFSVFDFDVYEIRVDSEG